MSNNGLMLRSTEYQQAVKAADPSEKQIDDASAKSVVVDLPPYWGMRAWGIGGYEWTLPGVEHPERQAYLARLRYHPQNIVFQAAAFALISQFISTSYEIVGKRRVEFFQNVLMDADKGLGWDEFWQKVWWDFLTLDEGAVIEVIGGGESDQELKSRELVVGIGYLDPLRCFFTGNRDYPVWYQDYYGKLHKMHRTRVIRLIDMPQGRQNAYNAGFCALSRCISAVQQAITTMTYTGEMLSNEPPPGMLNVGKVANKKQFEDAWALYNANRRRQGNSTYKPVFEFISAMEKAEIEFIQFSQAPAGYDFEKYLRLMAQLTASGIGMDYQDILPLVSGTFGTGTEAKTLDKKGRGKMIAVMFKKSTRVINRHVLPKHLEYKPKHKDSEQSAEEVNTAKAQLEIASMMQAIGIPSEAIMLYVANTVEAFKDVLLEEDGTLRVYDDDPKENEPQTPIPEGQQSADDVQANVDQGDPATQRTDDMQKAVKSAISEDSATLWLLGVKSYEDVLTDFSRDMYSAIEGANEADYDRRRAGTIIRANIAKYGRNAYLEGLKVGGVDEGTLDKYDQKRYQTLVTEASGYVSNLTERIYSQGMTEAQIRNSVTAWGNKTLYKFYLWGVESGDRNALMIFTGTDGKESCKDCRRLKGQIYRMYEWTEAKLRPGVDTENFECGGWECDHYLRRAPKGKKRSRGTLKMLHIHHDHAHAA